MTTTDPRVMWSRWVTLTLLASLASCLVGDPSGDETDGDDPGIEAEVAGSPKNLNIGFNGGADQFAYFPDFFNASSIHPGPRLCHEYIKWNVADDAPGTGGVSTQGSRAFLDVWLAAAKGHCDDALISFQAYTHEPAPDEASFTKAFQRFVAVDWARETGFTGAISYTPWNEPNNPANSGNGLGVKIEPSLAARYYLAMEKACKPLGCKVAAGDFASNGNMWNDFELNCANDNVPASDLCRSKSSVNHHNNPASYLDRYKNEIANHAKDYGLGEGFRPKYFAFHGWHDINDYLNSTDHCSSYDTCATRRILKSLGGSWAVTDLWDTETGIGQTATFDNQDQACGAAFLMRISTLDKRIQRMYVTRLHSGDAQLLVGHTPRPAMDVLARRQTMYTGGSCR